MDLRILITDENNEVRWRGTVYQDGSDSEGAEKIGQLIGQAFTLEDKEDRDCGGPEGAEDKCVDILCPRK